MLLGGRARNGDAFAGLDHATVPVATVDGIRLATTHLPGPDRSVGVVLAHGFTGAHRQPGAARIARALTAYAGVLTFDTRGHGDSAGETTLGELEVLDVDAVVAAMRDLGYQHVVTCGWSMGGSTVIRHAALHGGVDGVVAVSGTSRWHVRDTVPMRRLHWLVEHRLGRAITRHLLDTRLAPDWVDVPESPLDLVGRIAPIPLLLVHGDRDGYFSLEHPRALYAAAGDPSALWVIPGFGHAEAAATPELLARLGAAIRDLPTRHAFPA